MSESVTLRPVAYEIQYVPFPDPLGVFAEPFRVLESANAWWMDRGKVYALLFAFSLHLSVKDACMFATISLDQYKYFVSLHPEFSTLKERFESIMIIRAMHSINKNLHNPRIAFRLLDRVGYWNKREEEVKKPIQEISLSQEQVEMITRALRYGVDRFLAEVRAT